MRTDFTTPLRQASSTTRNLRSISIATASILLPNLPAIVSPVAGARAYFSNSAIDSTWAVCGNMSMAPAEASV